MDWVHPILGGVHTEGPAGHNLKRLLDHDKNQAADGLHALQDREEQ
jgi:hypothetical protein